MSTPKAIAEARARVKAVEQEIAQRQAAVDARKAAAAKVAVNLAAHRKRYGKPGALPIAGQVTPMTLGAISLGYLAAGKAGTEKNLAGQLLAGEIRIETTRGTTGTVRGMAQRYRLFTPHHVALVKRALARQERTYQTYLDAKKAYEQALIAAHDEGAKVAPELVAKVIARTHLLTQAGRVDMDWRIRDMQDRDLPDAQKHLVWAEARTKDACSCAKCRSARINAEWLARRAAEEKQRAKEEAAEARRIARLPRRTFTCPNCDEEHESPVLTERVSSADHEGGVLRKFVECDGCEQSFALDTIRSSPVGPAKGQQTLAVA